MNRYIRSITIAALAFSSVTFLNCKKTFEIDQEDVLERKYAYQDLNDADVAVMGVYGKFMLLAEQYIILNELRGDLLDATINAPQEVEDLSRHVVKANNPYIQPQKFYEVILNCNDVIHNLQLMVAENRIEELDATHRIADMTCLRAWVYLQLGIHFGEVPYFTDPVANVKDLENPALYQRIPFETLLDNLIASCEAFTTDVKVGYPSTSTLNYSLDGYLTTKFFVQRWSILGDLHLWKGNYLQAAQYYKNIMNIGNTAGGRSGNTANTVDDVDFDLYRLSDQATAINYFRGVYNWRNIFQNAFGETASNLEIVWNLPFANNFAPINPFLKWFSASDNLVQPSAALLHNWSEQFTIDNDPGDRRGSNNSYRISGSRPRVIKFDLSATGNALNPNAKWILLRASAVHLRFAEAANRFDRHQLAHALVNSGIINSYSSMQAVDTPPFDFDGRQNTLLRKTWYRNAGVRGRSGMAVLPIDSAKYYNMDNGFPRQLVNKTALVHDVENMILGESARENAFEGYRWNDLMRVALRRERESAGTGVQFLNNLLQRKYILAEKTGFVPKGSIKEFYLPLVWEE